MDLDREPQKIQTGKKRPEYEWQHYQAKDVQTEEDKEMSVSHCSNFTNMTAQSNTSFLSRMFLFCDVLKIIQS